MKSNALGNKIVLKKMDELMGVSEQDTSKEVIEPGEKVVNIKLSEVHDFFNHTFKVIDDESMDELVESIRQGGVLTPIIVRPRKESGYEIIAGHRRRHASQIVGKEEIPAVIKELSDEEATVVMVDTNIQRPNLLPSEKAFSYKARMDALKKMNKSDNQEADSANEISKKTGDSRRKIFRYIRLTYLIPEFLELVDNKKMQVVEVAVPLSYLSASVQKIVYDFYVLNYTIPTPTQASLLKNKSDELKKEASGSELTSTMIASILANQKAKKKKLVIKENRLNEFFPEETTEEEMEEIIYKLLETWRAENN